MPPSVVEKATASATLSLFSMAPRMFSVVDLPAPGCAEETAWPFLQPVLFPGEPDIDSIADPAERKRRILLKQFYVSGIIGTFRAALSGSIMTTPTEIGHFVSEELLPRIAPHMQMPSQSETAQQPAASPQAQ